MNFSYNPDFYPTPKEVINKMLMDDSPAGLVVLEPSAGSGNIARALRDAGAAEVLTCEIDPNLQPILRRDGFRLIASNFMSVTAEQVSHVNMIVMNPPFSQGVRHIQHAYDIAPAGCVIVALCNTSNLESGYYSSYREFAELVNLRGYSENLGDVFSTAERKTACRVSLVKLWKEGQGADEFNGYFSAYEESDNGGNGETAGLMQYNFLRDIVNRYIEAVKLFDGVLEATEKINRAASFVDYTVETDEKTGEQKAVKHTYGAIPVSFEAVSYNNSSGRRESTGIDHATYKKELQKYYWRIIFKKMNMEKYATRELREQINRFIEQRQNVPFTMSNIYRVIETVVKTNGQRMNRALCEAFDTICSLSAENSTAGETWKTNSNYMVNRRFICDRITTQRWGDFNVEFSGNGERITDVCKALCYMTGQDFEEIGSLYSYVNQHRHEIEWGKWFEWGFFRCRGYKKGTMHFEFIDENIWARFNQEVAKSKGWKIGSTTNSEYGHKKNRRV